jgi:hypothetical protein
MNRRLLLINAIGFAIILLPGINESNLAVSLFLAGYVAVNLLSFVKWEKVKETVESKAHLLSVAMSLVTAFDWYSHGSRRAYLAFIPIGFFYLLLAIA